MIHAVTRLCQFLLFAAIKIKSKSNSNSTLFVRVNYMFVDHYFVSCKIFALSKCCLETLCH